jgi:hypothetical protein
VLDGGVFEPGIGPELGDRRVGGLGLVDQLGADGVVGQVCGDDEDSKE